MKRFVYFLAVVAAVFSFAACSSSDGDDGGSLSDKFMYVGDSVKVGSGFSVDNKFVAYVSQDGYLHAFHVGETTYGNNGAKAKVTVGGRYKAFDVVTDWGISPNELKSRVHASPISDGEDDGVYMVVYGKVGCANTLGYAFKNNKLYMALALSSPADQEEILNYLIERYIFSPEEVDAYTWGGVDGLDEAHIKTFVALKLDSDYKYDYMLQTYFMSKELTKSNAKAKAMKMKARKMMKSTLLIQ